MRRLRVRFSKLGKVRFTSHRDVARIWERSLRRAGLPIAYTEGFSPRPKLSFGLALSTGYESLGEYLDISLRDDPGATTDPATTTDDAVPAPADLAAGLAVGIDVQAVERLARGAESLQQTVTSCTWHIQIGGVGPAAVEQTLAGALAATELPLTRERKGRRIDDDVRPAIVSARTLGPADGQRGPGTRIEVELATQPRALRPAELIAAIAPDGSPWPVAGVVRIHQWTQAGGARREVIPLPPAATLPPHAEARAS